MKKLAIIAILAASVGAASATEIGVNVGRNGFTNLNSAGVTVDQQFGVFGVEGAFDRSTNSAINLNRYSVLGAYDFASVGATKFNVKAGGAFIDPSVGKDGYAFLAGAGVSYPLTKSVKLVADYQYQKGQDRVRKFDGGGVSAGVKFAF